MAETDIKSINGRVVHDATARESAKKAQESADGAVKSVNGAKPDEKGNVQIEVPSGGITSETDPTVPAWAKQANKPSYTASEVGALPSSTKIPAKTSDLTNDSGFITRLIADLANYYLKSETYTRDEVNALVSDIPKFAIAVVNALPTSGISTTTVYLVGGGNGTDLYTEYIYVNGAWEILGSQKVDLTGYATETWVNAKLTDYLTANKLTAAIITTALGYTPAKAADVPAVDSTLKTSGAAADAAVVGQKLAEQSEAIADQQNAIDGKQPKGDYALSTELMSETAARENAIEQVRADMNQVTLNYAVGSTVAECLLWLEENGDPTLWYVLPDGFFYHCIEKETEDPAVPNFTNVLKTATIHLNKRFNSSNELKDADGVVAVDYVEVSLGDIIRTNKLSVWEGGYSRVRYHNANQGQLYYNDAGLSRIVKITAEDDGSHSFVVGYVNSTIDDNNTNAEITNANLIALMRMNLNVSSTAITEDDIADLVLTVNEEITYTTTGSGGIEKVWESTGNPVYPTKYDEPIEALEKTTEKHESRLTALESGGLLMEVFAPSPQLPADGSETADFNADRNVITCNQIYDYLNPLLAKYPRYITKETVGKDESGEYDWNRYTLCRRVYDAWLSPNYPKMYAWVNGSTVIYAESCSPRIGDTMYSTAYIGTAYSTVTSVDNPNQTRTVNGLVFTRDSSKDVEPTLVYTKTAYDPHFVGVYAGYENGVYNSSRVKTTTIASVIDGTMTDANGSTYKRYPLGDRNSNFEKLPVIVIGANEHGTSGDPAVVAIVTARMIKDLCENVNSNNPFLNLLKNDYMMVFCPVINPWGFTHQSHTNKNNVNIDRNFDTPGWGSTANSDSGYQGEYGGSENETQYFMNTLVESGTKIALANHSLGEGIDSSTGESVNAGHCHYMLGRDNSKYNADLNSIGETMATFYNLSFSNYGQAVPETYAKTRSYIDWIGAEGGALEMQAREGFVLAGEGRLFTARIMEADYTLLLQFLHMLIKNA